MAHTLLELRLPELDMDSRRRDTEGDFTFSSGTEAADGRGDASLPGDPSSMARWRSGTRMQSLLARARLARPHAVAIVAHDEDRSFSGGYSRAESLLSGVACSDQNARSNRIRRRLSLTIAEKISAEIIYGRGVDEYK